MNYRSIRKSAHYSSFCEFHSFDFNIYFNTVGCYLNTHSGVFTNKDKILLAMGRGKQFQNLLPPNVILFLFLRHEFGGPSNSILNI